MPGLSVLARLMKQGRFEEFETGEGGPRVSPVMPAQRGFTRGSMGSTGVRSPGAPQTRNSEAGIQEDRMTIAQLLIGNG